MISKGAVNKTNLANQLVFTNSARNAFKYVLHNIKDNLHSLNILLPAYIGITDREGSGIFDPIEANDAEYEFYALNNNLSIDMDSLLVLIETGKFNILLIVHYFGICKNDLQLIRQLCYDNNIILIEDCAHAFHLGIPEQKLGIVGDYSFYSVHKYLPVNSGGVLKINTNKFILKELPNEDKIATDVLEQIIKTKYIEVANKRRNNYLFYNEQLKDVKAIRLLNNLDSHEIPQTFPIIIKNDLREKLYFFLIERNLPVVALYYRLIKEIDINQFPISYQISDSILNLPIHQDITYDDIEELCNSIKEYFTNLQ